MKMKETQSTKLHAAPQKGFPPCVNQAEQIIYNSPRPGRSMHESQLQKGWRDLHHRCMCITGREPPLYHETNIKHAPYRQNLKLPRLLPPTENHTFRLWFMFLVNLKRRSHVKACWCSGNEVTLINHPAGDFLQGDPDPWVPFHIPCLSHQQEKRSRPSEPSACRCSSELLSWRPSWPEVSESCVSTVPQGGCGFREAWAHPLNIWVSKIQAAASRRLPRRHFGYPLSAGEKARNTITAPLIGIQLRGQCNPSTVS